MHNNYFICIFNRYTKTNREDNSGCHQLELGWIKVTNLLPESPYRVSSYPDLGVLQRRKNSKNPRLLWKWVGGSSSHSEFFFLQNHLKIALNQYWYFGVVYHVYSVSIYIAKSCWLLWFECSVHVSDGCPTKKFEWAVGGWGELYPIFLGFLALF